MRIVLIVSPHFPPTNAADMHRVRLSLPYYENFGWRPVVLAVKPEAVPIEQEPLFSEQIPKTISINRVSAIPLKLSRLVGIGGVAIRAYASLMREGARMIGDHRVDLVYFSTTEFTALTLGPIWKRRFGVPFVIDMQDPWVSDYPHQRRGLKHRLMARLHDFNEPRTMRHVDGLISVSPSYIETLRDRYPQLSRKPSLVLPFGGDVADFDLLRAKSRPNEIFDRTDGLRHGVYLGRGGADMARAVRILFGGFRAGLERNRDLFQSVRMHFVGTDYAEGDRARRTILPIAQEMGVTSQVEEIPHRIPYFSGLQLLTDADFLLIPGSDDPQYSASKVFPYILAERPFLAAFQEASGVVKILRDSTTWGSVIAYDKTTPEADYFETAYRSWVRLLATRSGRLQHTDSWSARNMTRKQCALFDRVVNR